MNIVYLTRRNLLTLLSKLDRNKVEPDVSMAKLTKLDTVHKMYPCSVPTVVQAIEDDVYYTDRPAGEVNPADDPDTRGYKWVT